jgi:hypothetical protein
MIYPLKNIISTSQKILIKFKKFIMLDYLDSLNKKAQDSSQVSHLDIPRSEFLLHKTALLTNNTNSSFF